jgi:pimeloyl-ACP methyl ester carboxylesterase
MWAAQVAAFEKAGHYCVCVHYPNASGKVTNPDGMDFDAVADAVYRIIKRPDVSADGKVDVVAHDWGAMIAYMLADRHPECVRKMVTVDVAAHVGRLGPKAMLMVIAYQWWLTVAFLLTRYVPWLGFLVGQWMTNACAIYFARAPNRGPWQTGNICFPYYYYWRGMVLGRGGVRPLAGYLERMQHPLLYAYGTKKVHQGSGCVCVWGGGRGR